MPGTRSVTEGEEDELCSARPTEGNGERGEAAVTLAQDSAGSGHSSLNEDGEAQLLCGTPGEAVGHNGSGGEPPFEMTCHCDGAASSAPASKSSSNSSPETCCIPTLSDCSCSSTTAFDRTASPKCLAGTSTCTLHGSHYSRDACSADGSSSEQMEKWKEQKHREMMQTVREMKKRIPSERSSRRKTSTIEALNYALSCVKQVQANSEYYMLLMRNDLEERRDIAVYNLEELESITSEHTLKNTDTFAVAFSLATGRVLYVSEQASSILSCKRKFLDSVKFVELLHHQDVNVFYSHTAQLHLPLWNVGPGSAPLLFECAQVKSFFCRIRGGRDKEGEMRYNPFRITPYLLKVQGMAGEEEHPCCLALAERIISGYEAPRIPMDKRIFTTTHSPGCVFMEVDDRAVPLLGYLPQDLIGTSVLTCLHPEDRTLMLAMHRKIVKYAGQLPFEHSPIRFRCQNGDYATLDTSWSSFINPWSRKVAFIIGRHKVRTGPLNEDVFAAQGKAEYPVVYDDVKELQAKIYKLFLQPVHNNGSSGYGSLGSNGSHEPYISVASSSDSNGNLWEDTNREPIMLQQICADMKTRKNRQGQALKATTGPRAPFLQSKQNVEIRHHRTQLHEESRKQPHIPSYQQINCVDSIIRYLDSCTGPVLKRKSETLSIATSSSSSSEEDKTPAIPHEALAGSTEVPLVDTAAPDSQVSAASAAAVVGTPLTDTEAMSVVSVTSQCSYSSTIVHVPQPESEATALEDAPMDSEQADTPPAPARPSPSSTTAAAAATEEFRMMGLTKEVLSAHTQKEEQEYIDRFRHCILQSPYSSYLHQEEGSMGPSQHHGDHAAKQASKSGRHESKSGKPKHKRPKPQCSSDSHASPPATLQPSCPRPAAPDPPWPSAESLQPQSSTGPFVPLHTPFIPFQPPCLPRQGLGEMLTPDPLAGAFPGPGGQQNGVPFFLLPEQNMQTMLPGQQAQPVQPAPGVSPYMAPVIALVLPNYPTYPGCPAYPPGLSPSAPALALMPQPLGLSAAGSFSFPLAPAVPQMPGMVAQCPPAVPPPPPLQPSPKAPSSLGEDTDEAQQPALFSSSRSSSPLQLNLLQEEMPKGTEPPSSASQAESLYNQHAKADGTHSELGNHNARSTSSELIDLLLHEDARSGTGSNTSGSGSGDSRGSLGSGSGSGSNGTSSGHTGSSNSSKYFASNDSSDTSRKARKSQEAQEQAGFQARVEDSLWSMIQGMPEPVMMTYQIHSRDQAQVLKEDREKLLRLQPRQPWFTQEQKKELAEEHPWIRQHTVPHEINTEGCVICSTAAEEEAPSSSQPNLPDTSCSSETTGQAANP